MATSRIVEFEVAVGLKMERFRVVGGEEDEGLV
jgi:hypothetical protein